MPPVFLTEKGSSGRRGQSCPDCGNPQALVDPIFSRAAKKGRPRHGNGPVDENKTHERNQPGRPIGFVQPAPGDRPVNRERAGKHRKPTRENPTKPAASHGQSRGRHTSGGRPNISTPAPPLHITPVPLPDPGWAVSPPVWPHRISPPCPRPIHPAHCQFKKFRSWDISCLDWLVDSVVFHRTGCLPSP